MLDIERKVLDWVNDFEERTAGEAPTPKQVAEGVGLDELAALTTLLCLVRQGHLRTPRFALVKTREDLP